MAQILVQNRVALAMPQLPQEVHVQGISVKKRSPSLLLVVNLISPDGRYDDLYLSNYATIHVKDELLRVNGVGDVLFFGQRDYSMRVWLDPDKMAALSLTAADIVQAVASQNVQVAAGNIGQPPVPPGQQFQLTMSTLGRLEDVQQFADIVVKTGPVAPERVRTSSQVVRLRDVARLELGAQRYDQISNLDGRPTIGIGVFQLPGSNALQVADDIRRKMDDLKKYFPSGVDYRIVYDTTPFINESVREVFKTLGDAVLLVAIVVLLFLQDWKAMILPMIDVPVALIGTFAVMAVLGFTLNNLTLLGLVLAIGIVVDDAIVVLENIERYIARGFEPKEATIKAMGEITPAIISITLVLCSVFLPAAFITGITGQFFRQFALVIAAAMVISAINALTLTPARAVTIFRTQRTEHGHHHLREALPWWIFGILGAVVAYALGPGHLAERIMAWVAPHRAAPPSWLPWTIYTALFVPSIIIGAVVGWFVIRPVNRVLGGFFRAFNRLFDMITAAYGRTVGRLLRVSAVALLVYGGLLFLTYRTMTKAPTGFIPTQDQGYLLVNVQLPDAASIERTQKVMYQIQRLALGDDTGKFGGPPPPPGAKRYSGVPGIGHTVGVAGMSLLLGANGSNFGTCFLVLDDFPQRGTHDRYDATIAERMQRLCAEEIDDAVVNVFRAPPIQGLGSAGGFKFQVQQRGRVDLPQLQRTTDELVAEGNKDPRLAGLFSLFRAETPQLYVDIDRTKCESLKVDVQDVFTTLQVYMGGQYVNLFNKFGRTWQVNLMAEPRFRTRAEDLGALKVRNKLGEMVPLATLASVRDIGGPVMIMRYNMYVSAAVNGNPAPATSSGEVIQIIGGLAEKIGVPFEWTEITYMQILAGNVAIFVFGLGTLLVYLVLAAKYESWRLPLSVILVVPLCLLCAVTGMLIARMPVDIFVQIGFLVLVGLAAKNAILIVEFAEQLRADGKPLFEAAVEASRLRLRPIVMTSFAFILGVVPLAIGEGAGAEMRRSLGTAVVAGMLGVTLFGIFLTPVFYFVIMWWSERRPGVTPLSVSTTADGEALHRESAAQPSRSAAPAHEPLMHSEQRHDDNRPTNP
jgi:multidrug efflux pump